MSSDGDASPISALVQSVQYATSPVDVSGFESAGGMGVSELGKSTESLSKRPFLKRGSRMPKSKIPLDPFTPTVAPIKNPPKPPTVTDSEVGAHDLLRPRLDEESPPRNRPITAPPLARRVTVRHTPAVAPARMTPSVYGAEGWDEIATKHTNELETFLRDQPLQPVLSTATFRRQRGGTTDHNVESNATTRPVSREAVEEQHDMSKLSTLDEQIAKFRKENEYCKKLRLERETALGEAQRFKERALRELEAAEKDIAEQRALVVAERRKVQTDRDRGRSVVAQLRELSDENRLLKQKLAETESEGTAKVRKMKNEISRLNACVAELQRSKFDLEEELRNGGSKKEPAEDHFVEDNSEDSSDGRREAVFASGLRKTVWPSGAAVVRFPNGDVKETTAAGVVIYRYSATGCTQTTYPDGLEVLQFSSGQVEKHFPDGSKEIVFANGDVKRIGSDGVEI